MKLHEEMQFFIHDACGIKIKLKDIEEGRTKDISLKVVGQNLADLLYEGTKLWKRIMDNEINSDS